VGEANITDQLFQIPEEREDHDHQDGDEKGGPGTVMPNIHAGHKRGKMSFPSSGISVAAGHKQGGIYRPNQNDTNEDGHQLLEPTKGMGGECLELKFLILTKNINMK
jgi:hypothetical protein